MSERRPVWISADERKQLDRIIRSLEEYGGLLGNTSAFTVQRIREGYDAAPTDAEGEVARAHALHQRSSLTVRASDHSLALNLLRALGMPDE